MNYNSDKKITIEDVDKAWARFNKLKEEAEQYMFVDIFLFDSKLTPYYNDLKVNWNEDHAKIFIEAMDAMFKHFGIDI